MGITSDAGIDGVIAALRLYKGAYGPTIAIRCLEEMKAERNAMRWEKGGRPLYVKLLTKMREESIDQVTERDAHRMLQSDARRMVRDGSAPTEMDVIRSILRHAEDDLLLQPLPAAHRSGPGRKPSKAWAVRRIAGVREVPNE
jgi:hypothetical protein